MFIYEDIDKNKKKLEKNIRKLRQKNVKLQDKYADTKEKLERRIEDAALNKRRIKRMGIFFLILILLGTAVDGGYYLVRARQYEAFQAQLRQREDDYQKILETLKQS